MRSHSRFQHARVIHRASALMVLALLLWLSVGVTGTAEASVHTSRNISGSQLAAAKQCPWPACAKILSAVAAGTKVGKLPANLSPSLLNAESDLYPPPGLRGCVVSQSYLSTSAPCVYNAGATTKRMVLLGDSHAEMWSPAVAAIAQANGYSLLFLSKIPCPLPMVAFWNALNSTPNTQCTTWKKWAFSKIQQFDPSIVVATTEDFNLYNSSALPISQSEYSKGLVTTLKDLSAPGRRVILLGDIPYLSQTGPICLAAHESSVQSCSTPTSQAVVAQNQAAQRVAASKAGADYINVVPWFCTQMSCPAIVNNLDVYSDGTHISATYSLSLEAVLSQSLGLQAS